MENTSQIGATTQTKSRNSNLELLRIICMLLIVAHHFSVHWGGDTNTVSKINNYVLRAFMIGGRLGVNIFVLISGYFCINSKFSPKRILKIFAQTLFYSIIIYVVFLISSKVTFNLKDFLSVIFPLSTNQYWFVTCYVLMLLFAPFVNLALKHCDKKSHLALIAILLILQAVIQPIVKIWYVSNACWFITLYIVASYIKMYPNKYFDDLRITLPVCLITFAAMFVFNTFWDIYLCELTNIVCIVCSISAFCSFKNFKAQTNKFIDFIAATTLGVYLVHDNPYVRQFLWSEFVKVPLHAQYPYFIGYALVCVATVYLACSIIDVARIYLFKGISKLFIRLKRDKTQLIQT